MTAEAATDGTADPRAELRASVARRLRSGEWMDRFVGTDSTVRDVAEAMMEMLPDAERDEQLRAEGRAQANAAIAWETSCVGCAERYAGLRAEREAGIAEGMATAARAIADMLTAYGLDAAAALVRNRAVENEPRDGGNGTRIDGEPRSALRQGSGGADSSGTLSAGPTAGGSETPHTSGRLAS